MIASLRNGLADGLTVTRHHRTLAPTRCRSRYIHPSVYSLYGKSWRLSSAVTVYTPASRFVSTATPPTKESSAQDVPLPSLSHGARPKVTLRPAPIKPNDLSPEVPPAPQPAASAGPLVEQASTAPKGSQGVHPSAVETVRWDYQDAAEHGILQPPPENASWFGRIYHQAKELFKFYWNGMKLVNTNRIRVKQIKARVQSGGAPLARWETRFMANYKQDALKLIPFVLIIIIAEEAIPFVVLYAPFLLPSTCLLPSQKERIANKRREKQKTFADSMQIIFEGVYKRAQAEPQASVDALLDREAAISYCGVLSLSTFGPPFRRLRKVKDHLAGIVADDILLLRENITTTLREYEVQEALEERGIVTAGLAGEGMRARLQWWLAAVNQTDVDPIRRRVELIAANAIGKPVV